MTGGQRVVSLKKKKRKKNPAHTPSQTHTHWVWSHLLRLSSRVKRAAHPNLSTTSVSRASVRKNREIEEKGDKKSENTQRERH